MRKALLAVAALVLGPAGARAEINLADSVEWMTVDARLVVRGKVVGCKDSKGPGDVVLRDVTVRVEEALKGKPAGKTVTVRLWLRGGGRAGKDWEVSGRSYLFFLRQGQADDGKELEGKVVLREPNQSVIDLKEPGKVYTADMKRAADGNAVMALVRKYAAKPALPREVGAPNVFKPQQGYLRLEVPFDAPIHRDLWAGSVCYLNVPVEPKHLPLVLAKARSQHSWDRRVGAEMLRNFPGPASVKALTALLTDTAEAHVFGGKGELVRVEYPVRASAYAALLALGEKPPRPVLQRKPTAEEVRKARTK
jgi:hypothetical protein